MLTKQLLDPLKQDLNMPTRPIQAQDFLRTPVGSGQGRQDQQPACQIQGLPLQLAVVLAGFLLFSTAHPLCLLLGSAQPNDPCLVSFSTMSEKDADTTDLPCSGSLFFQPLHHL